MSFRYQNPIWPGYFADPFVLKAGEDYYAYGTAEMLVTSPSAAPRAFPILRSRDLVQWSVLGGALAVGAGEGTRAFWAPEVALQNGKFFLYYSSAPANRDEEHRLYVALADNPAGPFVPQGRVLPESQGFCIDAHPFRDPRDGRWYLFFATDFFEERAGTGLCVAALAPDLLHVAEAPRVVVRANADWQIYERNRALYGRRWAAWHTVEGPCAVAHEGRYFCFYSGGNWQTHDYGVSYAFAEHPLGPWQHAPDAEPMVLRQREGVPGPGHNSYLVAPDGRTELLVYHAWDAARTTRRMCLDRLEWTEHGPRCLGPTTTPQEIA